YPQLEIQKPCKWNLYIFENLATNVEGRLVAPFYFANRLRLDRYLCRTVLIVVVVVDVGNALALFLEERVVTGATRRACIAPWSLALAGRERLRTRRPRERERVYGPTRIQRHSHALRQRVSTKTR